MLQPGVARVVLFETRRASGLDERPLASHLEGRGQRVGAARANLQGQWEADPTGQPRPDQERVAVRVSLYRRKEPLPAGVSHVIRFLFRLAPQCPGRTFANVVMGM